MKDRSLLGLIGVFKVLKGLLLVGLAVTFLLVVRPAPGVGAGSAPRAAPTAAVAPGDADDESGTIEAPVVGEVRSPMRVTERLMDRARHLSPAKRYGLVSATLLYAGLFFIEGIGLLLKKRWAEWMVVVMTALFIPLEVYETIHKFTWLRPTVLVVNVAVLAYLIYHLRRTHLPREHAGAPAVS